MRGNFRKAFFAVVVLVALGLIAYHPRHRIHLGDFTWSKLKDSVAQANIWLLLLSLLGIYGCYAIGAVRWQRFSDNCGKTRYLDVFRATIMGSAAIFVLGMAIPISYGRTSVGRRRQASKKRLFMGATRMTPNLTYGS